MSPQQPDTPRPERPQRRWRDVARRGALLAALIAVALGAYVTGLLHMLAPATLGREQVTLREAAAMAPVAALTLFVLTYAILTGACLPVALVLSLTGGAIFGARTAAGAVLLGATGGALLTYAAARSAFAPLMRARAERDARLRGLLEGFERHTFTYVLMLRLTPMAPFALVNVASGLAAVPVRTYAIATLLGAVPSALIYTGLGAALGASLASRRSLQEALHSPGVILPLAGLAALSLLPVLGRRLLGRQVVAEARALVGQEPALAGEPAAVAGERAVRPDNPVAGSDEGERVGAVRQAHGAHGAGPADPDGEGGVAQGLPGRDRTERPPDAELKGGP